MKPHSPQQIRAVLESLGASKEQIQSAYDRSIAGIEDMIDRARRHRTGKYNGQTAEQWSEQLTRYREIAKEVCAS